MKLLYKAPLRAIQRAGRLLSTALNKAVLWLNSAHVGLGVRVRGKAFIENLGEMHVGDRVIINSGPFNNPVGGSCGTTIIVARGGRLEIGDDCGLSNVEIYCWRSIRLGRRVMLGGGCKVYDSDFHPLDSKARAANDVSSIRIRPVEIGDDVFVGAFSIILKGVHIGDRAIIGAGSVVTRDVPAGEIWAGNPASCVRSAMGEESESASAHLVR
jgi:acetyltransferase-like isoleucine patch superfamily enzyme